MAARIEMIQNMLKDEPEDSFLNYALALEYANINELDKAIDMLNVLIARDKDYLGTYYQLGQFYELSQQHQKAKDTYTAGVEIAKAQKNFKTVSELNQAIMLLDEDDD